MTLSRCRAGTLDLAEIGQQPRRADVLRLVLDDVGVAEGCRPMGVGAARGSCWPGSGPSRGSPPSATCCASWPGPAAFPASTRASRRPFSCARRREAAARPRRAAGLFGDALVQRGVVERDRGLVRETGQQLQVLLAEHPRVADVVRVEHAHDPGPAAQRARTWWRGMCCALIEPEVSKRTSVFASSESTATRLLHHVAGDLALNMVGDSTGTVECDATAPQIPGVGHDQHGPLARPGSGEGA